MEDLTLRFSGIIVKRRVFGFGVSLLWCWLRWQYFSNSPSWVRHFGLARSSTCSTVDGDQSKPHVAAGIFPGCRLGRYSGIVLAPATRPMHDMGLMLGLKGFVAAIMEA